MKHNTMLRVMTVLSVVLFSIHVTDDIVRGLDRAGLQNLFGVLILVVCLSGALMLAERRSGLVIMLLGGVFAAAMPVVHLRGSGIGRLVQSSGAFLFIWTLWALGVTGTLSVILAMLELRSLTTARQR